MKRYLLDTHALVFWSLGEGLSPRFAARLDRLCRAGRLAVSAVSFWETALLAQKGRIELPDVAGWKDELVRASGRVFVSNEVNRFLKVMGYYPDGSLVELSDGRLAVVVGQNIMALLLPRVRIVTADGEMGEELDLREATGVYIRQQIAEY